MGTIADSAVAAADAVLSQAEAPVSNCCTVGLQAFAESEAFLAAEYAVAFGELAEAQSVLAAEAEVSLKGWIVAEAAIQRSLNSPNFKQIVPNLVLAEANVTEAAFQSSEASLAAQIANAEHALGLAEAMLQAEAAVFGTCCTEEAELAEAELAEHAG
jgi:hypothetical protein